MIQKTPDEIELMARAGAVLAEVHEVLAEAAAPGVTTPELDALAAEIAAEASPGSSPPAPTETHLLTHPLRAAGP